MTLVHGDPEDIEKARRRVKNFAEERRKEFKKILQQLRAADWEDRHYKDFKKQVEAIFSAIDSNLSELEDDFNSKLSRDAGKLKDYLNQ